MAERTASVEGVRRANLAEVLRLVHQQGPRSRAVITTETGLNRSTVADLVAELGSLGLVVERVPDPTRRVGRPSPIVAPSDDVVTIAINPEIDSLEVGAVTLGGSVRTRVREIWERPPTVAEVVSAVVRIVQGWREGDLSGCRVIGVGAAVPGLVRTADGVVRLAPHLGWHDEDLGAQIAAALELSCVVDNDASLGVRAERLFGAAREHQNVIYLNGGASGIGGGLVLHGSAIAGVGGYAGEWGQTRPGILAENDRRTVNGVLEDEVNRARLLAVTGLGPVDDVTLADAVTDATDAAILDEVSRQRRILAAALANAVNVLNPSIIVLGGFLAILLEQDPQGLLADVRAQALAAPAEDVDIRAAALGPDRLLIGAAEAAFGELLADPVDVVTASDRQ